MFSGLKGVKDNLDGPFSPRKVTPFMNLLKTNRLVSASGDTGCLVVYRDDDGNFRGDFSRHMWPLSEKVFRTKKEIADWLAEWMPQLSCDIIYVTKAKKVRHA